MTATIPTAAATRTAPKYLLTKGGLFKDHPDAVDPVIRCPECGRLLLRAESGWVCARVLWHTRIVLDGDLLARLQQAIDRARRSRQKQSPAERRWLRKRDLATKLLRFLKCRSRWMARLDAGEDQISGREPPAFRDPAPEPAARRAAPAERPYCPACRERDKVVLPSDPAPKHKRFAKPYCARCGDTLDRLPKHKLSPPDFD